MRVWLDDDERATRLTSLGFSWSSGSRAVIFALEPDREAIESFSPTIFTFERDGFEHVPTNEFVARAAKMAIAAETLPFEEARRRWRFALIYVNDPEALAQDLRSAGIDHQIQT